MRSIGRYGDGGVTRDPVAVNVHPRLRGLAIYPKCDGWREPERLVEARAEVWKSSDGRVRGDDNIVGKSLIYFLSKA